MHTFYFKIIHVLHVPSSKVGWFGFLMISQSLTSSITCILIRPYCDWAFCNPWIECCFLLLWSFTIFPFKVSHSVVCSMYYDQTSTFIAKNLKAFKSLLEFNKENIHMHWIFNLDSKVSHFGIWTKWSSCLGGSLGVWDFVFNGDRWCICYVRIPSEKTSAKISHVIFSLLLFIVIFFHFFFMFM
jgi:hypothetical protein